MIACGRTWDKPTGDPGRCVLTYGHQGAHRAVFGDTYVEPADRWRAMAYNLARLLERECDARGVMPDDVAAALGWWERMEKRPPT